MLFSWWLVDPLISLHALKQLTWQWKSCYRFSWSSDKIVSLSPLAFELRYIRYYSDIILTHFQSKTVQKLFRYLHKNSMTIFSYLLQIEKRELKKIIVIRFFFFWKTYYSGRYSTLFGCTNNAINYLMAYIVIFIAVIMASIKQSYRQLTNWWAIYKANGIEIMYTTITADNDDIQNIVHWASSLFYFPKKI